MQLALDAGGEVVGMEAVQDEQAADERIFAEGFDQGLPGGAGVEDDLEHALEGDAVKFHEQLNELAGGGTGGGVYDGFQLVQQAADAEHAGLKIFFVFHESPL